MDTYLLLRSNKQSGPYSLQQLVNNGLKPYDLVWVEGKSAAWRYPSEVDGLKDHAPKVEEQPYDRFYKKPEKQPEEKPITKTEPVQQKEEVRTAPVEHKAEAITSKKVFVAMPENHPKKIQPAIAKPVIADEKPEIVQEKKIEPKPIQIIEEKREPVLAERPVLTKQVPVYKEPTLSSNDDATLNEKYSESLDDIKRRYTETYLNRKKRSKWTSTHTSIAQVFGGAVFFCLLVVFAYKNFAGEEKTSPRTTVIQPDKRAINTTIPNNQSTVPSAVAETNKQAQTKKSESVKKPVTPPAENNDIVNAPENTEELTKESRVIADDYKPEKKAVMPAEEQEKTEVVKPKTKPVNIRKFVNVRANNYKQRAFGGVMNLELTVNNDSKFELDRVTVELQYLKPSEQPIKTETIVFSSIGANDSKTLRIPDYLRGVKIAYRVMGVESSQYERQTAGL
jgi:hypothetical protein